MLLISILSLLLSNAVTLRRDMSILFNRIAIISLTYCILHDMMSLFIPTKGLAIHGGLLHITSLIQTFHIFIFIVSILILQLTSFYPRKVWAQPETSSAQPENKLLAREKAQPYITQILGYAERGGEHF